MTSPGDANPQYRLGITLRQSLQEGLLAWRPLNRRRIEHNASTNRHYRRELPSDEAVSGQQQRGLSQAQPRKPSFSRRQLLLAKQRNRGDIFKRVGMKMYAGTIFQRPGRWQQG